MIVKADIMVSLHNYKRYLNILANKIFTVSDDFIVNKLNEFFIEITEGVVNENILEIINTEIVVERWIDFLDMINDEFLYTYDESLIEEYGYIYITNLFNYLDSDIRFKIKTLSPIHKGFNQYPNVRMLNNYYGVMEYYIKVEK